MHQSVKPSEQHILVVDYMSVAGHRMFNDIQIQSIIELGCKITIIGRNIDHFQSQANCITIPEHYYGTLNLFSRSVSERLLDLRRLFFINKFIRRHKNFSAIVVLTYDVITVWFLLSKKKTVYLYNHNNIPQLNKVKLFITRLLPANFIQVVANQKMYDCLSQLIPNNKITIIPHGFPKPYLSLDKIVDDKYIFCPISSSFDFELWNKVMSEETVRFLLENGIKVHIKGNIKINKAPFVVHSVFMQEKEYRSLLCNSTLVFLPYAKSFGERVSGVFFETIGNNIPVITSSIDCFKEYCGIVNYDYMVESDTQFIAYVNRIFSMNHSVLYKNLESQNPSNFWKRKLI